MSEKHEQSQHDDQRPRRDQTAKLVERIIFITSLVVVLGVVIGLFLADPVWQQRSPQVSAAITNRQLTPQGLVVHYQVVNKGKLSVSDVIVQLGLEDEQATITQTIAHLPRGAKQDGVAFFPKADAKSAPEAHVVNYLLP